MRKERPKAMLKGISPPAIHEGGHADFLKATRSDERLRQEQVKLRRRLVRFCNPRGIVGDFLVFRRKRRLLRKLRVRFGVPYAVFVKPSSMA